MKEKAKRDYVYPEADVVFYGKDVVCSSDPFVRDAFDAEDFSAGPISDTIGE